MMQNMRIWEDLCKTDPKHTKSFKRAGGFSGTAIKPIYSVERMTEQFGPYGQGWGVDKPDFQIVTGHHGEQLVYCTLILWWMEGAHRHEGPGVGGDKIVTYFPKKEGEWPKPERWENDDEAFKKAFTDAMANAMKHLGMSADVHKGQFDDNKYVRQMEKEFAEEAQGAQPATSTRPPAQVSRGGTRAQPATPQAASSAAEDSQIADWKIWITGFMEEFEQQPTYIAGREYLTTHKTVLDNLKEAYPDLHKEMGDRVKDVLATLPKEAG